MEWAYTGPSVPRRAVRRARGLALSRFAHVVRHGSLDVGRRSRIRTAGSGVLDLGAGVVISEDVEIYAQGELVLGDSVFVNRWCYLSAFASVRLGDRVRLGERVSIHDENHSPSLEGAEYLTSPVVVGDDVWIGANVVVLPGARIGSGSVIGAQSVVSGEIPAGVMAAGVPATPRKSLA